MNTFKDVKYVSIFLKLKWKSKKKIEKMESVKTVNIFNVYHKSSNKFDYMRLISWLSGWNGG